MLRIFQQMNEPEMYRLVREIYPEGCIENASDKHPELTDLTDAIKEEEDYFVEFLKRFFKQEQNTYYVLETNAQWVSALRLTKINDFYYMESLETAPEHRKNGYAARLINEVITYLSQYGPVMIRSNVNKKNEASLATHRKCGFTIEEENGINYLSGEQRDYVYGMRYVSPKNEWKVYFGGGFLNQKDHGRAGKELRVEKHFHWGDSDWYLPAVYDCSEGLVLDLCVEASAEKIQTFMKKWNLTDEYGANLSAEEQEQAAREHPLNIDVRAKLAVDGRILRMSRGSGLTWIPESCIPEGTRANRKAKWIVEHYGLDPEKGYGFHRMSFPWGTKNKSGIKSFELMLEASPVALPGIRMKGLKAGDVIRFTHPLTKVEHTLTVHSVEANEIPKQTQHDEPFELPSHYTEMTYALWPDIPDKNVLLKDCCLSDQPRRREPLDLAGSDSRDCACSIEIIGGADGPTTIFLAKPGKRSDELAAGLHIARSSFHFEPVADVEWRMEFREKLREDVCVPLNHP